MKHKTRSKAWARRYLKVMNRNILSAFDMGYEDGAAGKPRQAPPFPEEIQPGTPAYGVVVFAQTMYDKGYTFGKKVAE